MVSIRQFDICRVTGQRAGAPVELAVVLQHNTSSDLTTRVVAPLIEVGERHRVGQATPAVEVHGKTYLMAAHMMATVPTRNLEVIATIADQEMALKNAIDFLFFGI
jgi:hypothetical protein